MSKNNIPNKSAWSDISQDMHFASYMVKHDSCPFVAVAMEYEMNYIPRFLTTTCSKWMPVYITLPQFIPTAKFLSDMKPLKDFIRTQSIKPSKDQNATLILAIVKDYAVNAITEMGFTVQLPQFRITQNHETIDVFLMDESSVDKMQEKLSEHAKSKLVEYHRINSPEDLSRIRAISFEPQILAPLTSDEQGIILTAIRLGYFESPRRITLNNLASEIGMSSSALSSRLRTIYRKMLETALYVGLSPTR